ncbi:hypothetical protein FF38_10931 [Lucilia cuprina]|uniref:Uncharacterized protein n=1 Tax=Lucilia cuprina TaxID=7375 RepID=A0A0L0C3N3_LUCCU|nr:hypothetical protein CVS40_9572 [Lucilia cuprina]KNC26895.1 hypothetical protein FF38_10931 [Lucilia cuprina]
MSGKLIMKRKLDKTHQSSLNNKVEIEESVSSSTSSSSTSASSSNGTTEKHKNPTNRNEEESSIRQPQSKRLRCDTPPPEPEDLNLPPLPLVNEQNRHLLQAIQLKMLELQNELEAFEHDVEAHEEDYYYLNDHQDLDNRQNNQMSEQEAEALGFAMCAQETMLFLQREGVPSDSLLYTRLRDALVGRSQPDRVVHL